MHHQRKLKRRFFYFRNLSTYQEKAKENVNYVIERRHQECDSAACDPYQKHINDIIQ